MTRAESKEFSLNIVRAESGIVKDFLYRSDEALSLTSTPEYKCDLLNDYGCSSLDVGFQLHHHQQDTASDQNIRSLK